jgi:hypothetical protein
MFASAVAAVLALAPMIAIFAEPTVAPHAIAQGECTSGDTPDDYTLQCAPAAVPDFNDQLSEAEVAEPGFNGGGGGGGGTGGGGGHGGGGGGGHR